VIVDDRGEIICYYFPDGHKVHDIRRMPNGNFLLLSSENRVIDGWYTSETEAMAPRATANVIGDVIIEMTQDGEVLREWKLHDILDPYRIAYQSLRKNFWSGHYGDFIEGPVNDNRTSPFDERMALEDSYTRAVEYSV